MRSGSAFGVGLVCLTLASGGTATGQPHRREIFVAEDEQHHQWCGHTNKAVSKKFSEEVSSFITVAIQYADSRIEKIHVAEGDESGDWNVDDQYTFDSTGKVISVSRVIDNFTIGVTQAEEYRREGGKLNRKTSKSWSRRTRESAPLLSGDYLPEVRLVTDVTEFPFWQFLRTKGREVLSQGRACSSSTAR